MHTHLEKESSDATEISPHDKPGRNQDYDTASQAKQQRTSELHANEDHGSNTTFSKTEKWPQGLIDDEKERKKNWGQKAYVCSMLI